MRARRLNWIRIVLPVFFMLGLVLVWGNGSAPASTLPDDRAYELVSPVNNQDVYLPIAGNRENEILTERLVRASADGNAVIYVGDPPAVGGNGSQGNGFGDQYLAKRAAGGWTSNVITPLASNISTTAYNGFSSDLSVGVLGGLSRKERIAAGGGACDHFFSFTNGDGILRPFFTEQTATSCSERESLFAGLSADDSHLLFQGGDALTPEAKEPSQEESSKGYDLYDSVAGQLHLVNVLPDGETDPNATFGSPRVSQEFIWPDFDNVISPDASRVFWTDLSTEVTPEDPAGTTRLFVRENDTQPQSPLGPNGECTVPGDACTVQLDDVQGGPGSSGGGRFLAASSDGSKVFFTDCSRLTPDATAVSGPEGCAHEEESEAVFTGNDLYEYDFDKPVGERLTDLTVDSKDPLGADVQGLVAINETGEAGAYIYFVAGGALASGATSLACREAKLEIFSKPSEDKRIFEEIDEEANGLLPAGRGCNLYVLHTGEPIRLVKTLAPKDDALLGPSDYETNGGSLFGDWHADLGSRMAEATPDGHTLVFRSTLSLTGYENHGFPEIFVYNSDTEQLSCVSCDPDGSPPVGEGRLENTDSFAGYLPPSTASTYMLRWVSADGSRVFFDTPQPLVPQDSNGHIDVYEWERDGSGGCVQGAGCIYLLSGGIGSVDSYLLDASASGDDVFLASREQLVPEDLNETVALYDVRVDGGFSKPSLACTGTGCQGVPPAPPIFATPSSVTFNGVGNFEAPVKTAVKPKSKPAKCKRGFVKKKGRCVRKAKRSGKHSKRGRK